MLSRTTSSLSTHDWLEKVGHGLTMKTRSLKMLPLYSSKWCIVLQTNFYNSFYLLDICVLKFYYFVLSFCGTKETIHRFSYGPADTRFIKFNSSSTACKKVGAKKKMRYSKQKRKKEGRILQNNLAEHWVYLCCVFTNICSLLIVEIFQLSFCVCTCACPIVTSSIFGKSFHFPFPYFELFSIIYLESFHHGDLNLSQCAQLGDLNTSSVGLSILLKESQQIQI